MRSSVNAGSVYGCEMGSHNGQKMGKRFEQTDESKREMSTSEGEQKRENAEKGE